MGIWTAGRRAVRPARSLSFPKVLLRGPTRRSGRAGGLRGLEKELSPSGEHINPKGRSQKSPWGPGPQASYLLPLALGGPRAHSPRFRVWGGAAPEFPPQAAGLSKPHPQDAHLGLHIPPQVPGRAQRRMRAGVLGSLSSRLEPPLQPEVGTAPAPAPPPTTRVQPPDHQCPVRDHMCQCRLLGGGHHPGRGVCTAYIAEPWVSAQEHLKRRRVAGWVVGRWDVAARAWGRPTAPQCLADPLGPWPGRSDLGQGGVGIGMLLLDGGPEAISTWGGGEGGRWATAPPLREAVWAGDTLRTHRGVAARLCGAGAGPVRPPPGQAGPGPGPGQRPAGDLWGGGAC